MLSGCQATRSPDAGFYFPAEWEEQESVWLGWSADSSIQQVQLQMAKALDGKVGLTILSRSDTLEAIAMRQLAAIDIDTAAIKKRRHYIPNVFIRDVGPRFLKNKTNPKKAIADFAWSNYGYPAGFLEYQFSNQRGTLDNDLATENNWEAVSSDIIIEGGALDVSSDMILCFKETALQRNPGKSLQQIESAFLRVYGKKKMLWLNRMPVMDKVAEGPKAGNFFGYGANGHTDEFVRFANDSTILIGIIDPAEKTKDPVSLVDYDILQENLQLLRKATDVAGHPFHIIAIPVPSYSVYAEKQRLDEQALNEGDGKILFRQQKPGDEIYWLPAVSYLNFLISNKTVLVASYWREGLPDTERKKDIEVIRVLSKLFPGREIKAINPMALNRNGGGMHCASQQQPK
jgi:agmatine deiminase